MNTINARASIAGSPCARYHQSWQQGNTGGDFRRFKHLAKRNLRGDNAGKSTLQANPGPNDHDRPNLSVQRESAVLFGAVFPEAAFAVGQTLEERMRGLIREVIEEVASEGRAVIVAHAASMALGAAPDVLRVLVTASTQTRAARLASADAKLGESDASHAVDEDDRRRVEYFKRFYGLSEELPTYYDLVINTDTFSPQQVVRTIVSLARA